MPLRRLLKRAAIAVGAMVVLLVLAAGGGALWLRVKISAALPRLDGEVALEGLSAAVTVERDALGVPTIRGACRLDVARVTGFLHAQDRFFQMDLMRRRAAGELAELFGQGVLGTDRAVRIHRFRDLARRVVEGLRPDERVVLTAYAEGVNAGLAELGSKPFEYIVLRAEASPWRPEDTPLVVLAMYLELNDETGRRESAMGLMHEVLPLPLVNFLAPRGTDWDAPVVGGPLAVPPPPGPDVYDLRKPAKAAALPSPDLYGIELPEPAPAEGSNNWAVSGAHTAHGGAILANDMHLGIGVPNTWYRASLVWTGADGGQRRMTGVMLPGTPAVIVGSNGRVAWGFTNSYGDWGDVVLLESAPGDKDAYLTPEGPRKFEHHPERIAVARGDSETLDVVTTIWGPVISPDHSGRQRAVRWIAHELEAVNNHLMKMEEARNIEEAFAIAHRCGVPPQNLVVADSNGRIGWTIMGLIPRRVGFDGRLPVSWADGSKRWDGWLASEEYPQVVDPPAGRLWTANARVVDGEMLAKIGDGGYDLGARARQIRDDVMAVEKATEKDMLAIQLDDRALFLERWHDLLLRTLAPDAVAADPRRGQVRDLVEKWTARAAVDSVGYRLVRAFRSFVAQQVLETILAPCRKADPDFSYGFLNQYEGPLWRLVTERPVHLLNPKFKTWDGQLLAALDATLESLLKDRSSLAACSWGERNTTRIRHPLSLAFPAVGRWLDMPARQLPGDQWMPRVQSPTFGASERMVVSPGHEEAGIFHMPCGQSGNPLSPHYRDGHGAWEGAEPAPFLPGPPIRTLTLRPRSFP